ncbi:hypothetical protein ACFL02_00675 [Planctomycetota bacterium]
MTSKKEIKNRALMMGIKTGDMPEIDLIWSIQQAEGNKLCFGQGSNCQNHGCRWRPRCIALDSFAEEHLILARSNNKSSEGNN